MGRLEHAFNDMAAALERRWREAGDDQRGTQELVALLGREIRASLSSTVAYMDTLLADARGIEALDSDARFRALEAGRESAAQALDLINRRLLDPREPVD
jgi:signal transduction histidine kinase